MWQPGKCHVYENDSKMLSKTIQITLFVTVVKMAEENNK